MGEVTGNPGSARPAPEIPVDRCLMNCGRKAQPENGLCRVCEWGRIGKRLGAVAVFVVAVCVYFTGCVTLQESERREKEAACGTWASAIGIASRFEGRAAEDIVWDLKGWKELECGKKETTKCRK